MSNLDPTYLRYIYDGLTKGSIHPENESELPDGLIGLYEEAFEEHLPVMERQQTLKRFALFALLKKEVSVSFVAEVLEESEEEILAFISNFSSWFNSPESGKYQLYHERLKVFLLEKLAELTIMDLNNRLITILEITKDSNLELYIYKLEFLITHNVLGVYFDLLNRSRLLECLNNPSFIDDIVSFRIRRELVFTGMSRAIELSMCYEDWEILNLVAKATREFHKKVNSQIENDLKKPDTDWNILFEHFNAAPDSEEKIKLFFLIVLENRDWTSRLFELITEILKNIGETEYINLAEHTPIWLLDKTKTLFEINENLNIFFEEADHDELIPFGELKPNYIFAEAEALNDYPRIYVSDYHRILKCLSEKKQMNKKFFSELYESINTSNLITKDEIACRVTANLIENRLNEKNTLNWFFWLVTVSDFELGEHSWGRINTYELCILLIKRGDLSHLRLLASKVDDIEMDYHTKIKLRNAISEGFMAAGDEEMAKEVLVKIGNSKGERLDASSWIRSWILKDPKNRAKAKEKTHKLDKLEISFQEFKGQIQGNELALKKNELFTELNSLDLVSRAEYLADFATRVNDLESKESMLSMAWELVNKPKDWAEVFAKLSVLTAALEIMPKKWNERAFRSTMNDLTEYELEDYEPHLTETLFKTDKFRFAQTPPYQNLKENYPNEFKYLLKEFPRLCAGSESEIEFKVFLEKQLNNYFSVKDMWRDAKMYFIADGPGEIFTGFWEYIKENTMLFEHFTVEDVRVINVIARKVGVRFPFERFTGYHQKIGRYAGRFIIPDEYHLGIKEGLESMAKFSHQLEFDQGFRTVFASAMRGSSKRYDERDWTKDPIHQLAFALKKVLPYADDVNKVDSLLSLRTELIQMN